MTAPQTTTPATANPRLTTDQVARFHEQGYLLPDFDILPADDFARLTDIFTELLNNRGDVRSDELDVPHFREPRLLEFLLSDPVLDLVEPILGPDIALWSSHFISKQAYEGRATPWHEDSAYWKGRIDDYSRIVTVWLAIDRSTRENGCMRVIPGTHNNGFSEYEAVDATTNTFATEIRHELVPEDQAVYFEREPNQASLHDGRIVHGAEANHSPYRRCGYTMRYISTAAKLLDHPGNLTHQIWLARGRDLAGNTYVNA